MRDTFSTFHPIINFTYFSVVIVSSMFFIHPALLCISLSAAFVYSVYLNGKKAVKFNLLYLLPTMILISLINPMFNHSGITILFYFRDNPITMESIVYGMISGVMLASVILWFSCYNAIMTSDKFIYLFGKVIPALSLIFSMVLRFVPKFKNQIFTISSAQKGIGRDFNNGTYKERIKNGIKIMSIMITWALENAIETADSMKARGYGLKGRTSFSNFRFDSRDRALFLILLIYTGVIIAGAVSGQNSIQYFPSIRVNEITGFSIFIYSSYFLLCFTPITLDIMEEVKWRHLQSRI